MTENRSHIILDGPLYKRMLSMAIERLRIKKAEVNALNVYPVPDGDTGTNMLLTLESAHKRMGQDPAPLGQVAGASSTGSLMGARGNSGVILSQFFRGIAARLEGLEVADGVVVAEALESGVKAAYSAVMRPVEGTILTVGRYAARAATERAAAEGNVRQVVVAALESSRNVLLKTPDMLDVLREAGVVDAGGQGLVYLLEGMLAAIDADSSSVVADSTRVPESADRPETAPAALSQAALQYPFDMVVLLESSDAPIDRDRLEALGDSIVLVEEGSFIKLHIHSDRPDQVLALCLSWGRLLETQIENMEEQTQSLTATAVAPLPLPEHLVNGAPLESLCILPIVMGQGLHDVFCSLGAQTTIYGGQTMNPSTEDILRVVETCESQDVVLLPNNSNLILVCQQVQELSSQRVHVVPTTNVAQGIAAMMAISEINQPEAAADIMWDAAQKVLSLEVTYSVDDRRFGGLTLARGDIIGFVDGKLITVGSSAEQVLIDLIHPLDLTQFSYITVFSGAHAEAAGELDTRLRQEALDSEVRVDVVFGGQEHYYYLAIIG